jgi:hypothetical protein
MSTASSPLDRRHVLLGSAFVLAAAGASKLAFAADVFAGSTWRKISDADWKKRLPAASYEVLRHEDTERPGTSIATEPSPAWAAGSPCSSRTPSSRAAPAGPAFSDR